MTDQPAHPADLTSARAELVTELDYITRMLSGGIKVNVTQMRWLWASMQRLAQAGIDALDATAGVEAEYAMLRARVDALETELGYGQAPLPEMPFWWVNLSGGEFADVAPAQVPGRYEADYVYPLVNHGPNDGVANTNAYEGPYWKGQGYDGRLLFSLQRVVHAPGEPVDQTEIDRLRRSLDAAHDAGMKILLSNYQDGFWVDGSRYYAGHSKAPLAAWHDAWASLVQAVGLHPALMGYAINGEPVGADHGGGEFPIIGYPVNPAGVDQHVAYRDACQAAIDGIRSGDATCPILVPSLCFYWAGRDIEVNSPLAGLRDRNWHYDHHFYPGDVNRRYSDFPNAPNHDWAVSYARPFVDWCRMKGVKLFIGETGAYWDPTDPAVGADVGPWKDELLNLIRYAVANKDVISGVALWGAGPWWGPYNLGIEPLRSRPTGPFVDQPQLGWIAPLRV